MDADLAPSRLGYLVAQHSVAVFGISMAVQALSAARLVSWAELQSAAARVLAPDIDAECGPTSYSYCTYGRTRLWEQPQYSASVYAASWKPYDRVPVADAAAAFAVSA
jgi:hypothetical protein